ncbi:hypothetical protein F8M41_012229 [Gigaspora margarita]|uniref:Uncharacterized protein n=1 Tax=Gigaspora margarita TaxID=4874 RepID=A0A8H4A144_GIGMA|nr:hypothetical protein F8M41_012229 [Gigaspora margarita]
MACPLLVSSFLELHRLTGITVLGVGVITGVGIAISLHRLRYRSHAKLLVFSLVNGMVSDIGGSVESSLSFHLLDFVSVIPSISVGGVSGSVASSSVCY